MAGVIDTNQIKIKSNDKIFCPSILKVLEIKPPKETWLSKFFIF
jgi:hypothetical protein